MNNLRMNNLKKFDKILRRVFNDNEYHMKMFKIWWKTATTENKRKFTREFDGPDWETIYK
tara:strand:- start:1493 stop:1672 length:180 start_codon:yes stop_codon:yes gene_type:complete